MKDLMVRFGGVTAILGGIYLLMVATLQASGNSDIQDNNFLWQTITLIPLV